MTNIDCDQIILFGLVAMFSVYIYNNILNSDRQGFSIGGQANNTPVPVPTNVSDDVIDNVAEEIANNSTLNAEFSNNLSNQIAMNNEATMNALNNMQLNMENKLSNVTNNINNQINNMKESTNVNLGTELPGNSDTYIPSEFKAPEPNLNVDSLPSNYEVGTDKSSSCFPQDVLSAEVIDKLSKSTRLSVTLVIAILFVLQCFYSSF